MTVTRSDTSGIAVMAVGPVVEWLRCWRAMQAALVRIPTVAKCFLIKHGIYFVINTHS
jgi:hypothetical protein